MATNELGRGDYRYRRLEPHELLPPDVEAKLASWLRTAHEVKGGFYVGATAPGHSLTYRFALELVGDEPLVVLSEQAKQMIHEFNVFARSAILPRISSGVFIVNNLDVFLGAGNGRRLIALSKCFYAESG